MIKTVTGLTYADLDAALREIGFLRKDVEDTRLYRYPDSDALIAYPLMPLSDPVREYHLLAARSTVDGFGIRDANQFDLLLLRIAGGVVNA